ncbi:MAG: membrane protein insertion efficiency factor YidD [Thermodesulfobacteriota bacterium]|nr:MAG: membrane protein insertion efficiency factor YidD [Thermodesulfobacteriota bacterium]
MKNIFICLIRAYQVFISPFFPPSCRFTPSCSHYTIQAINTHGVFWGIKLGLFRVLRCHPFHPGGWDPVPPAK